MGLCLKNATKIAFFKPLNNALCKILGNWQKNLSYGNLSNAINYLVLRRIASLGLGIFLKMNIMLSLCEI